jgi:phage baseplate assembly protein W
MMPKSFLGKGWKFPVQVDPKTGRIKMSEYEEDISEAIRIILATSRGERLMRPNFGCGAQSFVFGLADTTTLKLFETEVSQAITAWEPRVSEIEVKIDFDPDNPGKLLINIQYVVRLTNNLFNLVFPFYLSEGIS